MTLKYCIYRYFNSKGQRCVGIESAASVFACYEALAKNEIYPTKVYAFSMPASIKRRFLKNNFLIFFFRQLATALESGIPLLEALHYMKKEQGNRQQGQFVHSLAEGVLAGHAFSEMLAQTGQMAPFYVQWVRIGEKRGQLAQVLQDISDYLARQEESRKTILGQLLYPTIVLGAIALVALLLFFIVLPILAQQFMGMDTPLPLMLRVPLMVHDFLLGHRWQMLAVLLGFLCFVLWYISTSSHRARWQKKLVAFAMTHRGLQQILILTMYVPFARLLGQLLSSGVAIQDALREIERYFSKHLFAEDIAMIQKQMTKGVPLSKALVDVPFVPAMARQMIAYSEKVGRLPETLSQSATYYENVIVDTLSLWIKAIEPVAILLLGVMVLLVALGLFVPILDSYQLVLQQ